MKSTLRLFLAMAIALTAARPASADGTPWFLTAAQYPIGSANALEPGDFDGDGDVDVASANSGFPNNEVAVILNDGTGRYGSPIDTAITHFPLDLAGSDFDEDGATDLAVATLSSTLVLLADGDGTFTVVSLSGQADTVACADFDGDGNADVAVTVYQFPNSLVRVFSGNGDGTFDSPVSYSSPAGSQMDVLFAVDTESDGDADLVYSDGSAVFTRANDGDGTFGAQVSDAGSGGFGMAVDYLDGDGNADLVTVDASGGHVEVSLGDGAGGFAQVASYHVIDFQGLYVATGEFTGDGKVDIAAGDDNDVVVLLRGRGDGQFQLVGRRLHGGYDLVALDVSSDGRDDLLGHGLRPNELSVAVQSGRGLQGPPAHSFLGFSDLIELGDVNGDGLVDAVGTGNFALGLDVLLNRGKGRMGRPLVSATTLLARALALADLNEDGDLDAVVGAVPIGPDPNLEVLLGDGKGRFAHLAEMDNGSANAIYAEGLDVGDMDGDGHLDLVSNTFAAISVLPGNGDGTFDAPILSGTGAGSGETVRVRDLDGDGILDVVTATWTGDAEDAESVIHLNRGNGDGTLEWVQSFTIGANNPHGDAADLNGDGLPDLAITETAGTHTGQGGMFVAINVGGLFAPPLHYDAEGASLALGDLNGDVRPEAVLTNAGSAGVVQVWTNTGNGTFHANPLELAAPDSPYEVELASLLGSPRLDLAVLGSAINPSRLVLYENRTGQGPAATETTPVAH
jgi:hypothetical protein